MATSIGTDLERCAGCPATTALAAYAHQGEVILLCPWCAQLVERVQPRVVTGDAGAPFSG